MASEMNRNSSPVVVLGENRVTSSATGFQFIGSIEKDLCNFHKTGKDLMDCLQEKGCEVDLYASDLLKSRSALLEIDSELYLYQGCPIDLGLNDHSSMTDIAKVGKKVGLCLFSPHKMALAGIHYTPPEGSRNIIAMLPQTKGTSLPYIFCLQSLRSHKHLTAFYIATGQRFDPCTSLMFWSLESSNVVMARLAELKQALSG